MAKSPRFFCENCGAEVNRNTKSCPRCGRYFASVRCPACGFTGAEGLFSGGCPVCGYSSPGSGNEGKSARREEYSGKKKPSLRPAGSLPLWVYILTIFFLLGVFFIFYWNARV